MAAFEAPVPLLPEILALHGKWRADKPAVVFEADTWSWATFTGEAHAFAHGLLAAGVQPGDRVGVVMSNGLAMVQVLFGCMAAGAVSVPLNLSVNDDAVVPGDRVASLSRHHQGAEQHLERIEARLRASSAPAHGQSHGLAHAMPLQPSNGGHVERMPCPIYPLLPMPT